MKTHPSLLQTRQPHMTRVMTAAALSLALLLSTQGAHAAEQDYADKPLFYASGVQPNVALVIDDSGSMAIGDAGGSYPYTSVCNSAVTINYNTYTALSPDAGRGDDGCGGGNNVTSNNDSDCDDTGRLERNMTAASELDRLEAAQQAACRVVQDNAASMRMGLYSFLNGVDGEENVIIGSANVNTLNNAIFGMTHGSGTPLTSTLMTVANRYIGANSPIQYRCQKNYVVFFTDGEASSGIDHAGDAWQDTAARGLEGNKTFTYPAILPAQASPWPNSNVSTGSARGSPGWDGYPDPIYYGGGRNVHAFLDDLAQMMFDVDFKNSSSTTPAAACGGTAPAVGKDCSGKSWDGSDDPIPSLYAKQNVITYTIGMGDQANNSLLRNTPLVNRITINPADVSVTADTLRVPAHGLKTGDFVQYHRLVTDVTHTTTATANTGTEQLTGNTTNMATGDVLIYSNAGGATLQYGVNTTQTCGRLGDLAQGSDYRVAVLSPDTFRLAPAPTPNVYNCAAAVSGTAAVGTYCRNITGTGVANTIHTFTRKHSAAGFYANAGSGVNDPVNPGTDVFTRTGHGLQTGNLVRYNRQTTRISPLYNDNDYYVARLSDNTFKLATSSARATTCAAGTTADCIDITTKGVTGEWHAFTRLNIGGAAPSVVATGSGTTPVNITANVETITRPGHGLRTGDTVTYTCADGTTVVPTVATTYYAIVDTVGNPGTFRLATSSANAFGGTNVNIVDAGNPNQTFTWSRPVAQPTIGGLWAYETDLRAPANPNYATTPAARGKYFVSVVDEDRIRLRQCGANFDCTVPAAAVVNLTSTGYGVLSTGPGKSYFASTAEELSAALTSAFAEIRGRELSFASLASNSSELNAGSRIYQARFNTTDWSGDVRALTIVNGTVDEDAPEWRAYEELPVAANRNIWTRNNTSGAFEFKASEWAKFTANQQNSLKNITGVITGTATDGQNVINWTRGEAVAGYRTRSNGNISDILNSSLVFVGQPNETYANGTRGLPSTDPAKSAYATFAAIGRTPMLYGGSNGGMLHGFEASNNAVTQGVERMAFIPEAVYMDWVDVGDNGIKDDGEAPINKFADVARSYYGLVSAQPHHFFVDGTPVAGDAFFTTAKAGKGPNEWHTVLVGGLGKGGRSVYALDITDNTFTEEDVLWEFTDGNSGDMGYSFSRPAIARLTNGQWVAIFGNGYDGRNDRARLFIVNIETGALIRQIDLGTAAANGLSSVSVLRSNDPLDGVSAIRVYAGDLQGNVWKVDISDPVPANWTSSLFFTATAGVQRQAITSDITLQRYADLDALDGAAPEAGVMLFFGTGAYFRDKDQSYTGAPLYDSMYGIWDNGTAGTVAISQLQEQNRGEVVIDTEVFATATSNDVNYEGALPDAPQRGWFMQLARTNPLPATYRGERSVFSPTVFDDFLIYSTVIPADKDPCQSGGSGALYVVNALTGGANPYSPFDIDGDDDFEDEPTNIIGRNYLNVLLSKPLTFNDPVDGRKIVCVGASDGSVVCEDLPPDPPEPPSSLNSGRMSWRQLQ